MSHHYVANNKKVTRSALPLLGKFLKVFLENYCLCWDLENLFENEIKFVGRKDSFV